MKRRSIFVLLGHIMVMISGFTCTDHVAIKDIGEINKNILGVYGTLTPLFLEGLCYGLTERRNPLWKFSSQVGYMHFDKKHLGKPLIILETSYRTIAIFAIRDNKYSPQVIIFYITVYIRVFQMSC